MIRFPSLNLRQKAVAELLTLGLLAFGFLLLFPERSIVVDGGLALFALALIGLNATYTRDVVWGRVFQEASTRWQGCVTTTSLVTAVTLLGLLISGVLLGYSDGGWLEVRRRVLNPTLPLAILVYAPWALVQQVLFQFYLLGRLRAVWPTGPRGLPEVLNGLAFALVHLPDIGVVLLTGVAGFVWSLLYVRYRLLTPLAISQAILGSAAFYFLYGRDLMEEWGVPLQQLLSRMGWV